MKFSGWRGTDPTYISRMLNLRGSQCTNLGKNEKKTHTNKRTFKKYIFLTILSQKYHVVSGGVNVQSCPSEGYINH